MWHSRSRIQIREAEHIKETEERENSGPKEQGRERRESVIARLFAHQRAFAREQQMGTRPTRRRTDCARAESQGKADEGTDGDCACNLSRVTSRNAPRERSLRFWPALHTANNANGHLCSGERERIGELSDEGGRAFTVCFWI